MADEQPGGDDYAARYMQGRGGALYHDKIRAPRFYHLLFLMPLLVVLGSAFFAHAPLLVPLLSSLPLVLIWLLFSVLRVSVSAKDLHVQYGLFGPRVPIEAIEACEAVEYDWKQYGGWGIRYGRDGSVAYNMLGDQGRAVRVTYAKGKKKRTMLLSSHDPERLATAIQTARAGALTARGGVRIEEPAAAPLRIEAAESGGEAAPAEVEEEAPPVSEKRRI